MATIQVHASFPRVKLPGTEVDLKPTNWYWLHYLTFPVETLKVLKFSPKPYKWIRYAIGVVAGAEGELSFSIDTLDVVNYDEELPAESVVLYYHINDEERRRMFPIDPHFGRTNVTSTVTSVRRDQFRYDVAERDGRTCVLTSMDEQLCDAVHLLAHSKGDAYITTYTQGRSRDPTRSDIIHEIDSTQNGLLLNNFTHRALGTDVAFLVTPNFAMNTDDIVGNAQPAERRCTAHLFEPDKKALLGGLGAPPSGTPLRMSDSPWWPPAILFDAVYANTVLRHFGTPSLGGVITKTLKNIFYPGGVVTAAEADYKKIKDQKAATAQRVIQQAQEREARRQTRIDQTSLAELLSQVQPDQLDQVPLDRLLDLVPISQILAYMPYVMFSEDKQKTLLEDAQVYAEAMEQRRVHDKVSTWIHGSL